MRLGFLGKLTDNQSSEFHAQDDFMLNTIMFLLEAPIHNKSVLINKCEIFPNCTWQRCPLNHWGWVMYICISKLTIIGSGNGLSPGRNQAIIWFNVGILLIGPSGSNFGEIFMNFHSRKYIWKCCLENNGHLVSASMLIARHTKSHYKHPLSVS